MGGYTDYDRTTSSAKAKSAAIDYARRLKELPRCFLDPFASACKSEDYRAARGLQSEVESVIDRLAPEQRNVFLYELGEAMGGIRAFDVVKVGVDTTASGITELYAADETRVKDPKSLNAFVWEPEPNLVRYVRDKSTGKSREAPRNGRKSAYAGSDLEEFYLHDPVKLKSGVIVIPVTDHVVEEGETYTFVWSVYEETSKSSGQESDVEVYVTSESSAKVGFSLKVISFSFDVKTGVKRSKKVYDKDERKAATRSGMQVSKSYVLQKILRTVRVFSSLHGRYDVETGYQIERKEGGSPLGPFWPDYEPNGSKQVHSAYPKGEARIQALLEETAQELAKRAARR